MALLALMFLKLGVVTGSLAELHSDPRYSLIRWSLEPGEKFNIVLNKVPKCASSSLGGVARTIGHYHGMYTDLQMRETGLLNTSTLFAEKFFDNYTASEAAERLNEPFLLATHQAKDQWKQLMDRNITEHLKLKTFKMASVRDPLSRCYSHYYFNLRRDAQKLNVTSVDRPRKRLHYLQRCADLQSTWFKVMQDSNRTSPLATYHHVIVTERFAESMVVLQELLQLDDREMLFVAVKMDSLHPTAATEPSQSIVKFIRNRFKQLSKQDETLVHHANHQLNLQIAAIDGFNAKLSRYKRLMEMGKSCVIAGDDGLKRTTNCGDCLYHDAGCCLTCLSAVAKVIFADE